MDDDVIRKESQQNTGGQKITLFNFSSRVWHFHNTDQFMNCFKNIYESCSSKISVNQYLNK